MHTTTHPITLDAHIAAVSLTSFHYGQPGRGKKVYIQASLHADEVPAMLVAHFLRDKLAQLDADGRILGEVILVPAANPIGLAQTIHGAPFGRFDLATGINFNRNYHHVADALKTSLLGKLGPDASANVALIREHARAEVARWQVNSATAQLKKTLLGLAIDADIMLDLHCDNEAVLHLYTGEPLADAVQPLAALMQAHALLVARESGGEPFDEACSRLWWELATHFGPRYPIPPAGVAITVELRGERDVDYAQAEADADALLAYLAHCGVLDLPLAALPPALCSATPLEGVEPLTAPQAGVLIFKKQLGEQIAAGDIVAEIVNPVSGTILPVKAERSGVLFARTGHRHLLRGMNICKIAGTTAFRSGSLLGS